MILSAWSRVVLATLALVVVLLNLMGSPRPGGAQDDVGPPVYVLRITGTIDLGLAPYVDRVVAEAEAAGASAIVIAIDTPGGRLDAVIQMLATIIDTDVRTVALIDSSAFSAGALVAIASDEIYMTPGAVLGAATPVQGGTGETADEKTISAVRATFESAAEANGRDPLVAAAMVDTRVEIEGLVTAGELLTLTVSEALAFGYAEGVVDDLDALLVELGLDGNQLVATSPGFAEQLVRFLTNPLIAGLLLVGGFLLIVGDFFSGGLGIAAVGGLILLAVFFWGHLLAGLAGWEDVVLMLAGVALLAVELFVLPGFGVAGILGLLALGAGAFLAMIYRDGDFVTTDDLWRAGLTVGGAVVAAVVGLIVLINLVSRRGAPSRLVLSTRSGDGDVARTQSGRGWLGWFGADDRLETDRVERRTVEETSEISLLGSTGVAVSDLRPGGIVDIHGRRVDAVTSGEFLPAGEAIEVIGDDRYRRVVRKLP